MRARKPVSAAASRPEGVGSAGVDSELRPLRPLAIDGFPPPVPEHVTSGQHPWSRPLLLIYVGDPPPVVQAFVDFVCSAGAQRLLAMAGHCSA